MADYELKTNISLGGDKEYKKALKSVNDELRVSKSNMQAAMSAYDKGDKSVKALTTKQKALSDVYDKQKTKVELMTKKLEEMRKSDSANTDEINKMQVALNSAITAMNNTGRQLSSIDRDLSAAVEAEANMAGASEDLSSQLKDEGDKAEESAEKNSKFAEALKDAGAKAAKVSFEAVAAGVAAVGAAAVAAVKELAGFASDTARYVDDLNTLSLQSGVDTRTLQKWTYAANLIDVSVETMTGSMTKLTKNMTSGSKDTAEAFKKLGIKTKDSSGNLRDTEDVFFDIIDALGNVENDTERDALAMALLGKSAKELNPLIEAGADTLDKLGYEAVKTGYVMEGEAMEAAQSYQDSLDRMALAGDGLKHTLGASVAPVFQEFTDTATTAMQNVTLALKDGLQPGELEDVLAELIDSITGTFEEIIGGVEMMLPVLTDLLNGIITVIVDALPGLADTLLPAAFNLLQGIIDSLLANTQPIIDLAVNLLTMMAEFIIDNIPVLVDAATNIMTGLIDGITELLPDLIPLGMEMMINLALALVEAIPQLVEKLPEITGAIIEGLKNVDWIALGIELIQGLINGLTTAVTTLLSSITAVFQQIWDAILDLFGIHSPSTLAAEAGGYILEGLVEGFKSAVNGVIDTVKKIFGRIWDAIKSIFGFGKSDESKESESAGKDIMTGMKDGIVGQEGTVKKQVKTTADNILKQFRTEFGIDDAVPKMAKIGKQILEDLDDGLYDNVGTVDAAGTAAAIIKAFNKALGVSDGASSKAAEIGKFFAQGLAKGIRDNTSTITKAAQTAAKEAYQAAKDQLQIKSPSRVMMGIGKFYDEGFAEGIASGADKVAGAADRLADIAASGTSSGALRNIDTASGASSGGLNGIGGTNINVNYNGAFTANEAGVFGQYLARSLDLVTA